MRLLPLTALAVLALGAAGAEAQPDACRRVVPNDTAPSWSPDGHHLAFVRRGGDCTSEPAIYVVPAIGGRPVRLAAGGDDHPPAWSPDGTRLGFPSGGRLTVVTVRGRGLDQLARDAHAPAWSPDDRRLAFVREGELRIVGVDGSGEQVLATGVAVGGPPSWSLEGGELAYGGSDGEIHIVDVESGAARVAASHPAWDGEPVWAGLSGALLFVSARGGSRQLWSLVDGRLRQETFGPDETSRPGTSADGVSWAFVRAGKKAPGLHYWPPKARRHYLISRNPVVSGRPVLSPRGARLAWAARGRCGRLGIHAHLPSAGLQYEHRKTNWCEFTGTSWHNTMRGTPWSDVIDALAGNDVLLVRDGYRDSVRCGPGRDRVDADRKDAIARDCERVRRP